MIPYYRVVRARHPREDSIAFIDDQDFAIWLDPDAPLDIQETALTAAVALIQSDRRQTQLFTGLPDHVI